MRALAALLALALAAGCVGKLAPETEAGVVPQAVQALTGPSEEELARTPGALEGIVHDEAMGPVANATVLEPRSELRATTNAVGFFRLEGLVTGEHILSVSADGFVTRTVSVQARNGTTLEVEVKLDRAASAEPYAETRELRGFLGCAALVGGERHDCASADPNHRDIFEFELLSEGASVVLELAWDTEQTPAAPRMTLAAETVGYGAQDIDLGNATGEGYARIEVPQTVMEKYYPEGGLMRALVALADGDAPVALAAQASFTVYVTVFYHEPAPVGFSILSAQA